MTYRPVRPTTQQKNNAMAMPSPDNKPVRGRQLTVEEQWAMSPEGQAQLTADSMRALQEAEQAERDRQRYKRDFAAREAEQERAAFESDPDFRVFMGRAVCENRMPGIEQPAFQLEAPPQPYVFRTHVPGDLRPDQAPIAAQSVKDFALAGRAIFTVVSKKTGSRFTYKIRKSDDGKLHFVAVLTGPENTSDYTYLGTIFGERDYRHGRKSRIGFDAPSAKAFEWFWNQAVRFGKLDQVEIYHEGRCCRCGRALTVPESVAAGIGPECAGKL